MSLRPIDDAKKVSASLRGRQDFRDVARKLLTDRSGSVFTPAEHLRRWGPSYKEDPLTAFPDWCPLGLGWRVWDDVSRSQLSQDTDLAFEAGNTAWPLKSEADRAEALSKHADWANPELMPFVSVTLDAKDLLFRAARQACRNRGQVRVSLVDLRRRWDIGLPFLHAEVEMKAYGVSDPYDRNYQYYKNETLCLWTITQGEIRHTWTWEEIEQYTAQQLIAESEQWMRRHEETDQLQDGYASSESLEQDLDTVQPVPSGTDSDDFVKVEEVAKLASKLSISLPDEPTTQQPEPSATPGMSVVTTSKPTLVSADGRWMIIHWQEKVAIIPNPMAEGFASSRIPSEQLSLACLPKGMQKTFDTADFVMGGKVSLAVVASGPYTICWDLTSLRETGNMCPIFFQRCLDAQEAREFVRRIRIKCDTARNKSKA